MIVASVTLLFWKRTRLSERHVVRLAWWPGLRAHRTRVICDVFAYVDGTRTAACWGRAGRWQEPLSGTGQSAWNQPGTPLERDIGGVRIGEIAATWNVSCIEKYINLLMVRPPAPRTHQTSKTAKTSRVVIGKVSASKKVQPRSSDAFAAKSLPINYLTLSAKHVDRWRKVFVRIYG